MSAARAPRRRGAAPARIALPDFSLVVLIGPSGCGKSTFARRHFLETEIVSSDACRALVSDDETNQEATADAFDLVRHTAGLRLKRRKLTVIDATSVRREDRASLIALARAHHALPVAIVLDIDPELCHARNADRPNRAFGPQVPRRHSQALRRGLRGLEKEGFRGVHVLSSPEQVDAVTVVREPLWTDQRGVSGPFDIIGDVHGCFEELVALLEALGYAVDPAEPGSEALIDARPPAGRTALFVGDLCDRGPRNVDVLRLVMGMCESGAARCVMGNHDFKLSRWLAGRKVTVNHGLDLTVAELEARSDAFRDKTRVFTQGLLSHLWLADGRLVVAHAGLKEEMHGRGSPAVRSFAMFGDTTGEVDAYGLPVRLDWAREYRGAADVVYGHTPTRAAEWLNGAVCIDTGCVFGGALTALRWPERELVSVPAARVYAEPARPLAARGEEAGEAPSAQQAHDRLLFFDDYAAKLRVAPALGGAITIPEENAVAALEVMSRFAVDPRWLIHLPPTMAACPTATEGPWLEHPEPALDFFVKRGVADLVAQEKHMGSRALIALARDADAARRRFGVEDGKAGVVYTRTGRPFFTDAAREAEVAARLGAAMTAAGLWDDLASDWALLDAEVMPWSAKAQELLRRQYRPTATAAAASAAALAEALADAEAAARAAGREPPPELAAMRDDAATRGAAAARMRAVMEGYCWEAETVDALKIAPFHLTAAEGAVLLDPSRPHEWHMGVAARLAAQDPILVATGWRRLDAADPGARAALVDWWTGHTEAGGEGLVLKPATVIARDAAGKLVQPAMKVRGRDYLRLIYGPDYDRPENLRRLRVRGLGRKFSLAEREFKLGLEGVRRFVEGAPLAKVHECALAVLALESEPVDPRL